MRSHPFFVRVSGDALNVCGIYDGDVLIVEEEIERLFWNQLIVTQCFDGLIVERVREGNRSTESCQGVVTQVIRSQRRIEPVRRSA